MTLDTIPTTSNPRVWRKIPAFSSTRLQWSRCQATSWSLSWRPSLHPQRCSTTEMREAGKPLRCHMLRALNMCLASSSASYCWRLKSHSQLPFGWKQTPAVNDGSLKLNWVAGFLNHQQYWCKGSCVSKLFGRKVPLLLIWISLQHTGGMRFTIQKLGWTGQSRKMKTTFQVLPLATVPRKGNLKYTHQKPKPYLQIPWAASRRTFSIESKTSFHGILSQKHAQWCTSFESVPTSVAEVKPSGGNTHRSTQGQRIVEARCSNQHHVTRE